MCTGSPSSAMSESEIGAAGRGKGISTVRETATAQVIRRPGHGPNVADLNASKCLLDQGPLRNYVGIKAGVPQIADDSLQRPSRQSRATSRRNPHSMDESVNCTALNPDSTIGISAPEVLGSPSVAASG